MLVLPFFENAYVVYPLFYHLLFLSRVGTSKMASGYSDPSLLPESKITEDGEHTNNSTEEWLLLRIGSCPRNSLGWFRAGVGFYNKKEYVKAIECFEKSISLDPMNVNLHIMKAVLY